LEPIHELEAEIGVAFRHSNRGKALIRATWFFFLLALANLMWAGQGPAVKYLEHQLSPVALTFLPFYLATILLVPLLFIERRSRGQTSWPSLKDWGFFTMAGIFGQIAAQLGATWGTILSTASNYSILNLLIPVMTAVLATYMLRERMTPLRLVCLGIGLVGAVLLSVSDLRQASFINLAFLAGNVLCIVSSFGSAFYNVYCKGLLSRYGQTEILVYTYITASIASLPALAWEYSKHEAHQPFTAGSWWALAFLAVFMYGLSMVLFFWVLRHLTVTVASFSLYMVPIFGVLLSYWLVHERLNAVQIAGSLVVLSATLLIVKFDTLET
jgi:drug/metabolite transporter (DMT)-like permease